MFVSCDEIKKRFNITNQTLYNWRKQGKIKYKVISRKKFIYDLDSLEYDENKNRKIIAYCRVSNTKQKDDLLKQEEIIRSFCASNGIILDEIYSDIASGMNEDRKQFNKMLDEVIDGKIKKIYITFKDRFSRFGFSYFQKMLKKFDCEIIEINGTSETTFENELTADLISIIHHFSTKMYSNRRAILKKISNEIENIDKNEDD